MPTTEPIPQTDEETEAWFYNPEGAEDQTTPHQFVPNRRVTPDGVRALGVIIWKLMADNYVENPLLENIKNERGYKHSDVITFSPGHIADFEAKAAHFFVEHDHDTEEIRFVLEGTGYFDVRDLEDNWIRVKIVKGDFVILPPGMYHRFTLDETLHIKALRFFKELPEWTDETRPADEYVAKYTEIARCAETDASEARLLYLAKMGVGVKTEQANDNKETSAGVADEIAASLDNISLGEAVVTVPAQA